MEPEVRRKPILQNLEKTVDRAQKEKVVEQLVDIFNTSGAVVVSHYAGLSVAEMQDYRAQMRAAGASVRVAKNRLAKIALEGTPCEGMKDLLTGQTVLGFSEDPVAPAKVTEAFAKGNDKLVVLGGAMGETVLDAAGVKSLASMPSREEIIETVLELQRQIEELLAGLPELMSHWVSSGMRAQQVS